MQHYSFFQYFWSNKCSLDEHQRRVWKHEGLCDVTVFSAGACGEGTRGVQAAGGAGGEQVCVCQSSSSLSDHSLSLSSSALYSGKHVYSSLNAHLESMSADAAQLEQLTARLHIWPDFHGNRSPLADQTSRGAVSIIIIIINHQCVD